MSPISFGVSSHSSYWTDCPENLRHELFDDSIVWKTKYMGNNFYASKRQKLVHCLKDAYKSRKFDIIDEVYSYLVDYAGLEKSEEHYSSVLLWIESNMKNGYLFDYYDIYCALSDYYRDAKQLEKAIEYNQREFSLHQDILTNLQDVTGLDITRIKLTHVYPCTMYIHDLIDTSDFERSRLIQTECFDKGFYDVGNEKKEQFLISFYLTRLGAEVGFHKKNGGVLQNLDDLHGLESLKQFQFAATGYKDVGDLYFKQKDYKTAVNYYERALELWPEVYGVQSKLEKALKKIETT